jgi:hypothetical protein
VPTPPPPRPRKASPANPQITKFTFHEISGSPERTGLLNQSEPVQMRARRGKVADHPAQQADPDSG